MGHENIGFIAKAGLEFTRGKCFKEGDLVFVEHYRHVRASASGAHLANNRHCENPDWSHNPDGSATALPSAERPASVGAAFAQYVYPCRGTRSWHQVPKGVDAGTGRTVLTPMRTASNGPLFDGGSGL